MTITEFLAARLDEQESVARDMHHQDLSGRPLLRRLGGGTGLESLIDPARILVDIAAKRRLVELCATWIAEGERWVGVRDVMATAARAQAITAETVLRAMVQPYAERPAFDPAWRLDA